jgi:hypothetical protein
MEVDSDPYSTARQSRRFGMPYGASQSMNYPGGGANMGPAATAGRSPMRTRLPILPDMSSHPSVSPAGQGSSSGSSPQGQAEGAEAEDKLRQQIQQSTAARAQNNAVQTAIGQRQQAASIADYRKARDLGNGRDSAIASGRLTQQAADLGIDPSSDAKTVAAAASGKVGFDANGMPTGGDTRQAGPTIAGAGPQPPASTPGNVQPNPNAITSAVQTLQAAKGGAQVASDTAAFGKGVASATPYSPATPQPSTTAPMALRDGTTASAPPPAPVAAPQPPTPFAPAMKQPRKPRPGYVGGDDADPSSQPA